MCLALALGLAFDARPYGVVSSSRFSWFPGSSAGIHERLDLAQESFEEVARTFDQGFAEAAEAARSKLIGKLGSFDRPESAERLTKVFSFAQQWLQAALPEKEMEQIPIVNSDNVRWELVWRGFAALDRAEQARILGLEAIRGAAVAGLSTFKEDATVQWLLRALKERAQAPEREGIAEALAGLKDSRVGAALVEASKKDSSWRVRAAAVRGLASRKAKEVVEVLKASLQAPEWQLRFTAAAAAPGSGDPQLTPALVRAIADPRMEIRLLALSGVEASGDRAAVPGLYPALSDASPRVRALAASIVGRLGSAGALGALVPLFHDPEQEVRAATLAAVEQSAGARGVRALVQAILSPNEDLLEPALAALERVGRKRAISPLIEALASASPGAKSAILAALPRLTGSKARPEREWKTYWNGQFRKALSDFDAKFVSADSKGRVKLVEELGGFDRREAAERQIKTLEFLEEQARPYVQAKDQLLREEGAMPDLEGPGGVVAGAAVLKAWKAFYARQSEVHARLSELDTVKHAVLDGLANTQDAGAFQAILRVLSKSPWPWERQAMAEVLSGADPALAAPALTERVQKDRDWMVRVAAIDGLAALRAHESAEVLVGAVSDEVWHVQVAAVRTLAEIAGKMAVGPLVEAFARTDGRVRGEISDALIRLTGVERSTPEGWKAWWAANSENFLTGKPRDDTAGTETTDPPLLPTFYGFTVSSKRVLFILDRSGSMEEKAEDSTKIAVARREIAKVVRMLPEDTVFDIMVFSDGAKLWQTSLVAATKTNKEAAITWYTGMSAAGATNTFDALEIALQVKGTGSDKRRDQCADTIFFVTDGVPTSGRISSVPKILEELFRMNRLRKVRINTVIVGTVDVDPEFLRNMAEQNSGKSVWRK